MRVIDGETFKDAEELVPGDEVWWYTPTPESAPGKPTGKYVRRKVHRIGGIGEITVRVWFGKEPKDGYEEVGRYRTFKVAQ